MRTYTNVLMLGNESAWQTIQERDFFELIPIEI